MKEQVIQIPDTLEVKEIKDGKIILVEKEKKLTYEDIARKLFKDKLIHCVNDIGDFAEFYNDEDDGWNYAWNATSKLQLEKLLAINMLMNVAKYLNGSWQPSFDDDLNLSYYISYVPYRDEIKVSSAAFVNTIEVYFKSEELAKKAIEILGEYTIRLALCTDY